MTFGPALPCPNCQRVLEPTSWHSSEAGYCRNCGTGFEFSGFPALNATRARVVPKAVLVAEHATCFFHAENQAETPCASCGRFLCKVCAVEFNGRELCPACVAAAGNEGQAVMRRTLYDGIALALAFLPLLLWPFTAVTAPAALGFVIYGWRKPRSLVSRGRGKLILAGVAATVEIVAWIVVLIYSFTSES
jgi:hypothetical protein